MVAREPMAPSLVQFWSLLRESGLATAEQCTALSDQFERGHAAGANGTAQSLADWLVGQNMLSAYQSTVLLAGRAGPFHYGDYRVYDRLTSGRMSGLFRAAHLPTGHGVLLQFFSGAITQDTRAWQALADRVRLACTIVHRNVHRHWEVVETGTFKFLVVEDVPGRSLEQRLAAEGRLSVPDACRAIWQAAQGLAHIHEKSGPRGDICPANLWDSPTGEVQVLRDPLWVAAPLPLTWRQQPGPLARYQYLAPDMAVPGKAPDALVDIYALGCTFYELLSGRPPFSAADAQQLIQKHASEKIAPLEQFAVPQTLARIVAYMMAKNPQVRYQQAAIVAQRLAPFIDSDSSARGRGSESPTLVQYERWVERRRAATPPAPPPATVPRAPTASAPNPTAVASRPVASSTPAPPVSVAPSVRDASGTVMAAPSARASAAAAETSVASAPASRRAGGTVTASGAVAATGVATAPHGPVAVAPRTSVGAERAAPARRKNNMILLAAGLGGAALFALVVVIVLVVANMSGPPAEETAGNGDKTGDTKTAGSSSNSSSNGGKSSGTSGTDKTDGGGTSTQGSSGTESPPRQMVVPDDGALLWASPTQGSPLSLEYVPPGGQVFIVVRPADMLATAEGERVFDALGPDFAALRTQWEREAGVQLQDVEQAIVVLYANGGMMPRTSVVVRLREAAELPLAAWGQPQRSGEGDMAYYVGKSWSFYVPSREEGRVFVMGAEADIQEAAKYQGAPPALRREMTQLLESSDASRHVSVLLAPKFLAGDGKPLFAGSREKMLDPIERFLGDDTQAAMLSIHLEGLLFVELRAIGSLNKKPSELAGDLRDRLQAVPQSVEDYLVDLNPPPYWKRLSLRYKPMVTALHRKARVGDENDEAVVNSVLPLPAAHNLVLATELAINSAPGGGVVVVASGPPMPKTIEEVLESKISISFDQDSLEFSMQNVAAIVKEKYPKLPFDFEIKILGDDLKIDGITRNQQIRDFNQKDASVADVLVALVRKANPVTTVKDPSELDQKLVWVVGPDPADASRQIVLITTRQASENKSYTLPKPFQPK